MIDICICTFRRTSIAQTIESIAAQTAFPADPYRIVIADNDETPSARELVEATAARVGVPLTYVHAPRQNISIARNACLDAATADWVVFIDDDEYVDAEWLVRLTKDREQYDIVFGVSSAIIEGERAPGWLRDGRVHSNTIGPRDGAHNGYTCNVLIRRSFLDAIGLRFSLEYGRSGGEDTAFFEAARRGGARFGYVPDAIVFEPIPESRVNLGWLLKRRFRSGQTHYAIQRKYGELSAATVATTAAKFAFCMGAAAAFAPSPRRRSDYLMRGTLHLGFLASAFGRNTYQEYG